MSEHINEYVRSQFRELMEQMFPCGVAFGGEQHRDLVRVFLAGAFIMDRDRNTTLEAMIHEATGEGWFPGFEWNWKTGVPN